MALLKLLLILAFLQYAYADLIPNAELKAKNANVHTSLSQAGKMALVQLVNILLELVKVLDQLYAVGSGAINQTLIALINAIQNL